MQKKQINNQIIYLAQKGDQKAFEQIMNIYFYPAYHFIYRITNDQNETFDIVQESFLKIYLHLDSYDCKKKFTTWMFTIVQRTTFDWIRKKKRTKEFFILDKPQFNLQLKINLEGQNNIESKKIDIQEALMHLPKKYRTILELYYWYGYNYREISIILKRPINSTKTLLKRAKEKLRTKL